jgi:hypothetical protein
MNKYLIFIIPLFIWGCSKKYSEVIDPATANYQVTNVTSFSDTTYKSGDSVFTFSISLNSSLGINSIFFNVIDPDGNTLNNSPVTLFDDGKSAHGDIAANDNTFSNKYPFSQNNVNGKYSIKYFVVDNNSITLAAVHNFNYNNNQTDIPPLVSNLIAPDTLTQQDTSRVLVVVSITASDSNGRSDIQTVFYNSFKPDGNQANNGNPIFLLDNGNLNNGDAIANDGIYSVIVELPAKNVLPAPTGTYRWEFQARDREGILSNKIIHKVVIR